MDWFSDHWPETWLLAAIALGALELLSTDLILIMLAAGALVAMVTALLGGAFILQVILGLVTAIALMALLRPSLLNRLHSGPTLLTGADALIGQQAIVLEPMAHAAPGRVKIGGDIWTAQPYDEDDAIESGATVEVVSIRGGIAFVLRAQRTEGI